MSVKVNDVRTILLRDAGGEAELDGSRSIEAEHLLLGLTRQQGGPVVQLLADAGLTRDAIRAALDREWEQSLGVAGVAIAVDELPSATPGRGRHLAIGESAKLVLKRGIDRARKVGAKRITAIHILLGLLEANLGRVPRALELAGVDRAALHAKAIQAIVEGAG